MAGQRLLTPAITIDTSVSSLTAKCWTFTDKGVLGIAVSRVAGPDSIASLSRERRHHACRAVTFVADCFILWRRHPTIQIRLFPVRRSHV